MSINSRLDAIKLHLGNAYEKISSKGGTVPANKNIDNLANAIDSIEQGGGGPSDIRLNYPSLSFGAITSTQAPLIITNAYNGNFVESYDFYINDVLTDTISANLVSNTINLKDYISVSGTYTIKVIAKATNFLDSNPATIIYKTSLTITNILTHCSTSNAATDIEFGQYYHATLNGDNGYSFINASISITMDGVDITSTAYDGKQTIYISQVTGNIVITATFASIVQLEAPDIDLNQSMLTAPVVQNAEQYILCVNGVEFHSFDLGVAQIFMVDLSEWLTIQDSYNITIKAHADGYLDSYESNDVDYENQFGETPSYVLDDNSWPVIRCVCALGLAGNYWSLGDTKTDVGTDGVTRTFKIVDMQGLYGKHVVFHQVTLEDTRYTWNGYFNRDDRGCANNYSISTMRTTRLPSVLAKYSSELKATLTNTTYYSAKNGESDFLLKLVDKIFLGTFHDFAGVGGPLVERQFPRFQYYVNYYYTPETKEQWTRSAGNNTMHDASYIPDSGFGNSVTSCDNYRKIAPCFAF